MKQSEFKKTISAFIDKQIGKFEIDLSHFNKEIFLLVKHPAGLSGKAETSMVYCVYIDDVKHRVFYVGKSERLQRGILFKKHPLAIKYNNFKKWFSKSDKYDDYEVYFAWHYDFKDEFIYDYIPMSTELEAKPSPTNMEALQMSTVMDSKAFKLKAKNLHENMLKLESELIRKNDR